MLERATGKVLAEIEVGVEPEGMSVSPDDKLVAATSEATSMAHIIDTTTYEVTANILVDTRPRVAQFTHDGKQVWVSAEVGGTIAVIDPTTAKIVKKFGFQIPGVRPELIQPMGIIFSKDGKLAFVAIGRANRIAVVDTATFEVKQYILIGQRPWHMAISPDGSKLYSANGLTNDMTVIDVASSQGGEIRPRRAAAVGPRDQALAGGGRAQIENLTLETQPHPASSQPGRFCSIQCSASPTFELRQTSPGGGTR